MPAAFRVPTSRGGPDVGQSNLIGPAEFGTYVPRSLSVAEAKVLVAELVDVLNEHKEGDPDHQAGAARPVAEIKSVGK